jgi:hypothetical protein
MRPFFMFFALCAVGALALASSGLAGQPATQTLTPPPPPYETCKSVGSGTICQGTIDSFYGPVDTGLVCGSGASAFGVADSASTQDLARRDYDADGKLLRRAIYDRLDGQLSNEVSGATVPYTQIQITTDVLAVPGDLWGSATETWTGNFIARPATGAPVVIGAGRVVFFPPGGTIEFQAGPSGLLDLLAGDSSALDPICAALGATS